MTPSTSDHSQPVLQIPGYSLIEQLYQSSRTEVYRAVKIAQQRPVVIKVLRRQYPSFSEVIQFRNQYTILRCMADGNTERLPITGVVQPLSLEPLGSGYALVMEDFGGISLEQYAKQHSLDLTEVLTFAVQIAEILHELHQYRIVHKDIKPANILIHPVSKQIKLIDFSIATLLPKETQQVQSPNVLEGTLAYLAPEQTGRMNRAIDYRADFYALGVTLYQLLSGHLPFEAQDPLELIHCHIAKLPLPLNQLQPELPPIVAAIVAKLMAKNAEDRYQSAMGLKHDLEYCLTQWKVTGAIANFSLGQRDLSDRFLIPEKLYGRQAEVQSLLAAFDRIAIGHTELMLVAGFSGIGKTAVINEVHKPIVQQRGYFIKGKFDQFNRNIPLSAFVQALRDLMEQLLCESNAELKRWKAEILAAVGENGQVLIEVIPELEQIIGKQPTVAELSGSAVQNRFNLLFQKFIGVFTTPEHPLVIFLDDLQWADSASLQLIKLLMNDNGYLLVLGAYRDNEVSPVHPFILTVEELKKAQVIVNTITLSPLRFDDTNDLVADTLNCSGELAQPLTELVARKTGGNPFFITQFLKALHQESYICFNWDCCYWECNIAEIAPLTLSDDVVEFMAQRLQKLPPETQQMLKLAACIGNQFDLATLAIVAEQPFHQTANSLWKALQESLIVPTNQVYKFFQASSTQLSTELSTELSEVENGANPVYRFLHDRIQQAAYSLIPEADRATIHYRIGRLLLTHFSTAAQSERIFEIVGHWNSGSDLILHAEERIELARLNLIAGQKAMSATAYSAALRYFDQGIELLPENAWAEHYALTLELHHYRLESAYLNGKFEQLEVWGELVLEQAASVFDCIKVYETRMMALRSQGKFLAVVETGLQVLRLLGLELPAQPTSDDVAAAYAQSQQAWQGRDPMSLLDLPAMQHPQILAAMQILTKIVPSAHVAAPLLLPLLVFKQIELSIQYGNSPISIFSYADYGFILCGINSDISTGYKFGQLSLALLEKLQITPFKSRAYFIVNSFIRHWQEPLHSTIPFLLEGYRSGLDSGDWECVALNLLTYSHYQYWAGQELHSLAVEMGTYRQAIEQVKQEATLKSYEACLQTVLNLLGQSEAPYRLQGTVFDADQALPNLRAANDQMAQFYVHINQAFLCYLFEQDEQATQLSTLLAEYSDGAVGFFLMPIWVFYDALIQLRRYSKALPDQQELILEQVKTQQEKLHYWADYAPMNHQHKYELVAAELCRVLANKAEAIELYDRAIAGARENGYIQEAALASELAAKFYLDWGKEKLAQDYLINAYYSYIRWGAQAKVQDLEDRYFKLLAPILQQQQLPLTATETVFGATSLTTFQPADTVSSTSDNGSISSILDLTTVLKASHTLSSEIQLDRLLAILLHTVLENAGADKGALLMPREQEWFIEAIAQLDQPVQVQAVPASDCSEISHRLIGTVRHTLQPVVIVDAVDHPTLATDPYIMQHQPRSLLCAPILQQGKLIAILYLENHVTVGAFTCSRIELLNALCAQAAISLENARLYQQAQTYVQQIDQSQLQIVQSEKMASLGNLVAGVAHEINNPIGFLNGSITNAKDYVQDLLAHLKLYQQHYPEPATAIQDHAENIDLEFLQEDLSKLLDSMRGATDRIKNISTSLRTFSRADTEHKISANLHAGLDSALLILKYRLKASEFRPAIKVVREYGDLPDIECFPGQLNQVFMNILANAIDMFDEIAQTQSFENIEANLQQITIRTEQFADQVLIWIRDNGKGMSEAVQAKIFDHLFTTKGVGKGTGLGLAIARQIVVEKHGGSLEVQSEIGRGTEFCIRLPIAA